MRERLLSPNGHTWLTEMEPSGSIAIDNDIWQDYGFTLEYFRGEVAERIVAKFNQLIDMVITVYDEYILIVWDPK